MRNTAGGGRWENDEADLKVGRPSIVTADEWYGAEGEDDVFYGILGGHITILIWDLDPYARAAGLVCRYKVDHYKYILVSEGWRVERVHALAGRASPAFTDWKSCRRSNWETRTCPCRSSGRPRSAQLIASG